MKPYRMKKGFKNPYEDINMSIGELLKRRGIITDGQLCRALNVQRERCSMGRPVHLGLVIFDLGYASEREIVDAINAHYGISATSLSDNIGEEIRKKRRPFAHMIPAPRMPIWFQLSAAMVGVILLTSLTLGYVTLSQQKEQLHQQMVRIGTVSLSYFANNARIPILEENFPALLSLIRQSVEVEGIRYAVIVDNGGSIMAHTDHLQLGKAFESFNTGQPIRQSEDVTYFSYVARSGEKMLNLFKDISFQNNRLGEVHVGVSIDFIETLIRKKAYSIFLATGIIILLGAVIAIWLGFRFSKPVLTLVGATEEISRGNYQHKVDLNRNDELGSLAIAFNRMSRDLWVNSLMQKSFGKYVGTEVLEMIMANPESAWLKGNRNEATILFTDIRGFTAYAEVQEPEDVVEKLNAYLEIAASTILQYGGYVDKFIGDAVLGVFGVPVFHKDHVERAVRAAVEMQRRFALAGRDGNPLLPAVGIGINTGVVVSGNIGSQVKMEYTVIGDTVNVASRVNGIAASGEIILTEPVYRYLTGKIEAEPLPPKAIKGKTESIRTYRLKGILKPSESEEEEFEDGAAG